MKFDWKMAQGQPFKPFTFTVHVEDWDDYKAFCKWALEDQPRVDVVRFLKDKIGYALRNSYNYDGETFREDGSE